MATFFEIINSDTPTLVDFFAEWCGPCKTMKPILEELKLKMDSNARIIKIDIDKNQQVANTYSIKGVPALILFIKGQVKWRQSGVVSANELQRIILQHI